MNNIKIIPYSPHVHELLRQFMQTQYPNRSKEYISWWLDNIKNYDCNTQQKTKIAIIDDVIVGCTTINEGHAFIDGIKTKLFYEANTIISPDHRGLGIGKLLYNELSKEEYRCTIGMTNIAYAIESKLFNNKLELNPIRVYATVNWHVIKTFISRQPHNQDFYSPDIFYCHNKKIKFRKFNTFNDITNIVTHCNRWQNDNKCTEIIRDESFFNARFINIWRGWEYQKYIIETDNTDVGYVVYRKGRIYGIDIVAIVDYRCIDMKYEYSIFTGANTLAKLNSIGFSLCLTSREYRNISLFPIRLKLPKKIKGLATSKMKYKDILFTSADSDLDFVYYE